MLVRLRRSGLAGSSERARVVRISDRARSSDRALNSRPTLSSRVALLARSRCTDIARRWCWDTRM